MSILQFSIFTTLIPVSFYLLLVLVAYKWIKDEKVRYYLLLTGVFAVLLLPLCLPFFPSIWVEKIPQQALLLNPLLEEVASKPVVNHVSEVSSNFHIGYFLYFLILTLLIIRIIGGYGYLQLIQKKEYYEVDTELEQKFQKLLTELSLPKVSLFATKESISPMTIGIIKPIIVLPQTLIDTLCWDELELILLHELFHIKRKDSLWILVQRFTESLYFFHPLVWYLSLHLEKSREILCDDAVVEQRKNGALYAQVIYTSLQMKVQWNQPTHFLSMGFKDIKSRVKRIIGKETIVNLNRFHQNIVYAFILSLFITCLFGWGQSGSLWAQQKPKDAAMEKKLSIPVTLSFNETPIEDVFRFIQTVSGVNLVVHPKVIKRFKKNGIKVTLNVKDLKLKTALDILLDFHNLTFYIKNEVMVITSKYATHIKNLNKKSSPPKDLGDKIIWERLHKEQLSMDFTEAPLVEVIDFLRSTTGINMIIDPRVFKFFKEKDLKVDVTINKLKLVHILNLVLSLKSMTYRVKNGVVVIYLKTYKKKLPIKEFLVQKKISSQALLKLIQINCAKNTWGTNGYKMEMVNDVLEVQHNLNAIEEVEWFLIEKGYVGK